MAFGTRKVSWPAFAGDVLMDQLAGRVNLDSSQMDYHRAVRYTLDMLTIEVDGQLEERLKRAAESAGAAPQIVARRVLEENLPRPNEATLALLKEWERENSTTDAAELKHRIEEDEQFMAQLDRNRTESEGPQARKLWP